jgi:hypothetical protein
MRAACLDASWPVCHDDGPLCVCGGGDGRREGGMRQV